MDALFTMLRMSCHYAELYGEWSACSSNHETWGKVSAVILSLFDFVSRSKEHFET